MMGFNNNNPKKILGVCPTSIFVVDAEGLITYADDHAESLFRLSKSKMTNLRYNSPVWKLTDLQGNAIPLEDLPFSVVKRTGAEVQNMEFTIQWPNEEKDMFPLMPYH